MGWKPLDGIFEPTLRLQEPAPEEATVEGGSTVGPDLAKFGLIAARGSGEGSFWLSTDLRGTVPERPVLESKRTLRRKTGPPPPDTSQRSFNTLVCALACFHNASGQRKTA